MFNLPRKINIVVVGLVVRPPYVWYRLEITHTKLVDSQFNSPMRTISGSIMSTPVQWLPVLSNIAPASLRRNSASGKILDN